MLVVFAKSLFFKRAFGLSNLIMSNILSDADVSPEACKAL